MTLRTDRVLSVLTRLKAQNVRPGGGQHATYSSSGYVRHHLQGSGLRQACKLERLVAGFVTETSECSLASAYNPPDPESTNAK